MAESFREWTCPNDVPLEAVDLTKLDARDQDAIRCAVFTRLRRLGIDGDPIMPPGTPPDAAGALAEICRGWEEMLPRGVRR